MYLLLALTAFSNYDVIYYNYVSLKELPKNKFLSFTSVLNETLYQKQTLANFRSQLVCLEFVTYETKLFYLLILNKKSETTLNSYFSINLKFSYT